MQPEEEKQVFIIGLRQDARHIEPPIPGSKLYPCSQCDQKTWIAPTGQEEMAAADHTILCHICFRQVAASEEQVDIMQIAEQQLDEMAAVLGYRPDPQELRRLVLDYLDRTGG